MEIRNTHYRVSGFDGIAGNVQAQEELGKLISSGMTEERGLVLKSFPDGGCNGWTISEFGPLYIPAKGSVVGMNPETRLLYRNVIEWEQKKKLTFKERKEFEALETEIPQLEAEKAELETAMSSGTLSNDELLAKSERIAKVIEEIDEKTMRWLELSELA